MREQRVRSGEHAVEAKAARIQLEELKVQAVRWGGEEAKLRAAKERAEKALGELKARCDRSRHELDSTEHALSAALRRRQEEDAAAATVAKEAHERAEELSVQRLGAEVSASFVRLSSATSITSGRGLLTWSCGVGRALVHSRSLIRLLWSSFRECEDFCGHSISGEFLMYHEHCPFDCDFLLLYYLFLISFVVLVL